MTTYLMVHGSFVGGCIWQPAVERMRAAGHTVYAPTSDGCAERNGGLRAGLSVGMMHSRSTCLYHAMLVAERSGDLGQGRAKKGNNRYTEGSAGMQRAGVAPKV